MGARSTTDPVFRSIVAKWIVANGEVFAVIRYPNYGGAKSYEYFDSNGAFTNRVENLSPSTSIVVLAEKQLPCRGRVSDDFISHALKSIPDGARWLVVCQEPIHLGAASWFHDYTGDSHVELESELRDDYCFGKLVAIGLEPPWWHDDSDSIISAIVPNSDGTVTLAAY